MGETLLEKLDGKTEAELTPSPISGLEYDVVTVEVVVVEEVEEGGK